MAYIYAIDIQNLNSVSKVDKFICRTYMAYYLT